MNNHKLTAKPEINLNQKRTLCHALTEYWKKYEIMHPGDLMRREIEKRNKRMTEISQLRGKIQATPLLKGLRKYGLVLSQKERGMIKAALLHTHAKLNHVADKMDVTKRIVQRSVNNMQAIETIYKQLIKQT